MYMYVYSLLRNKLQKSQFEFCFTNDFSEMFCLNPLYSDWYPKHIDTISMGLTILYFKGSQVVFLNYYVFLSLKVVLI